MLTNCTKCGKTMPQTSSATITICHECLVTMFPVQERHDQVVKRSVTQSSFDTQVGGSHYTKLAIQPMEYSFKNKLDPCQHTAIKYITRFRDKGGREDLEKAIDCLNMLIELEYGK